MPDPGGGATLAVSPIPQVGFSLKEDGPVAWYPLHEAWTKEDVLQRLAVDRGTIVCVHTQGIPAADAQDEIERRGFSRGTLEREIPAPTTTVRTQTIVTITAIDLRAVAKIAFNYLAFATGAAFALQPHFNEVRRFVVAGVSPPWLSVEPTPNPWLLSKPDGSPLVGHYLVIRSRGAAIECDVSLLMRARYRVKLSIGGFAVPTVVSSAHLFDVEGRRVHRIAATDFPID